MVTFLGLKNPSSPYDAFFLDHPVHTTHKMLKQIFVSILWDISLFFGNGDVNRIILK